jgi:hypothetical protein
MVIVSESFDASCTLNYNCYARVNRSIAWIFACSLGRALLDHLLCFGPNWEGRWLATIQEARESLHFHRIFRAGRVRNGKNARPARCM